MATAKSNTSRSAASAGKSAAYLALIDLYAERNPHWALSIQFVSIDLEDVHTVLSCHPDLAVRALTSRHFAASCVDELNSIYSADTEDARLAFLVRRQLKDAAEGQVFEDVRSELRRRDDLPTDEPTMPATESSWAAPLPELFA